MLKHAYVLGVAQAFEESGDPGLIKEAVRLKGLHGTSGKWEKLIPNFGGALAKNEVNPGGVYAAIKKRKVMPAIQTYIERAVKQRGGEPSVAKVVIDTDKGWLPSSFTDIVRNRVRQEMGLAPRAAVDPRDVKDYVYGLISAADVNKARLANLTGTEAQKVKKELGNLYKELHESVGTWYTPNTVKPLKWIK